MTDYTYGSGDRVTLGGDTSDNYASGLAGYSLDIQPESDWPGTTANPSKLRFDTDKMKDIADNIDAMISSLEGGDVIQDVTTKSASATYGPDSWAGAYYLKEATTDVAGLVTKYSSTLLANLKAASQAIRTATGALAGGEQANVTTSNKQASAIDSSGM